jgi:hypothetical protein
MKNYFNHLLKNGKWSIFLTIAILMLLTFGLPSNTGWHSVREIEDVRQMWGFIFFGLAIVVLSWLQVYNEYKR